ncbi:MAG: class II aldolase/adducin family protein [Planctomycetota bacterium]|jgi:L-fuculose-phosphate aldolase
MTRQPVTPFADTPEFRRDVIETCFYMRDRLGYFVSTWGNISVRLEDGILVTPSRMDYEKVKPKDLVVVAWEGGVLRGKQVPTSEMELHRQVMLERPDLGAIIHSHSPWASVCACAHRSIPVLVDDMAEVIGGEVNCSAYVPAGRHRELAEAVRKTIGPDACAVLLGNHGVLAGGRDLAEAIVACQFVEKAAMILVQAQAIGGAKLIPEQLWREENDRYLNKYGKPEDLADLLEE